MKKDCRLSKGWIDAINRSKETRRKIGIENEMKYLKTPKKCKLCSNTIPYVSRRNTFCGLSCSASSKNIGVCRRVRRKTNKATCLFCKTPFSYSSTQQQGKYCSRKCSINRLSLKAKEEWLQGNKTVKRETLRKYLIEDRGNVCSVDGCGVSGWMGKSIVLVVDHIDGNAGNDSPNNVRLLCHNCNSQTNTFCGRNAGKGRKSRGLKTW